MATRLTQETPQYLRLLLYGIPGSTKTRTSASAALDDRSFPTLVLDSGGNQISYQDYKRKPDVVRIDKLTDLDPIYDWLANGQPASHKVIQQLGLVPGYKCLVLDTLTDLQRMVLAQATGNIALGPGTIRQPTQRGHFGVVLAQMVAIADALYKLPMHVIMTCQEKEERDDSGAVSTRPLLVGQSANEVPAYAHTVGWLRHKSRVRGSVLTKDQLQDDHIVSVVTFAQTRDISAKDQTGAFPKNMLNPTITKLLDLLDTHRKS